MIQLFCLMVFKIFLVIALMLFNLFDSISQDNNSILTNVDIQIEATAAINKMYNFEFVTSGKITNEPKKVHLILHQVFKTSPNITPTFANRSMFIQMLINFCSAK